MTRRIGDEARTALPRHASAQRADGQLHRFTRRRAGDNDAARPVDEASGGCDGNVQRRHAVDFPIANYGLSCVTIIAVVRSLLAGVTFKPFLAAQMFW